MQEETVVKQKRGFALLSKDRLREVSSEGGKVTQRLGKATHFNSETGAVAGRIPHEKGTAFRFNTERAKKAGRKGGEVSARRHRR